MGNCRERARGWKPTTDGAKTFQMWNSSYRVVLSHLSSTGGRMHLWLPSNFYL